MEWQNHVRFWYQVNTMTPSKKVNTMTTKKILQNVIKYCDCVMPLRYWKDKMSLEGVNRRFKSYYGFGLKE
jgi:hypothetical protein